MPWGIASVLIAFASMIGFALLARRLLGRFDEYKLDEAVSDGEPTVEDLWTRGGYGDPGPMG